MSIRTSDVYLNDFGKALKGHVAMKLPLPNSPKTLEEYFDWRKERLGESDHLFIGESGRRLRSQDVNQEIARIGQVA